MATIIQKQKCSVLYLGVISYEYAFQLQQRLRQARVEGNVPDTLLLLQHPPVITTGRFRGEKDMLISEEQLRQEGIEIFHANRGGSVTCHSPGQLIGYPLLNLKENGLGVREYIWKLEEVIIKLLHSFSIEAQRSEKHRGSVWVNERKVCSIGINVSQYITTHGFALNVSNDLRYFEYIRPCGLESGVMTSLSEILEHPVEIESLIEKLILSFSEIFALTCEKRNEKWLTTHDALSG